MSTSVEARSIFFDIARTDNTMNFQSIRRSILISAILQQRPYLTALVIELYCLVGRRFVVARRCRLKDQAIDSSEDQKFPNETGHL